MRAAITLVCLLAQASDFEIKLNNRVQSIRAVSYLEVAAGMTGAVGPSFDAAPAAPAAKGATTVPRVFILLIDDLSFSPLAGKELFATAHRFVSSLPPTDLAGVTTTTGTVAVNPTADRAPLLTALLKITGAFQDPRVVSSGPSEGKNPSPSERVIVPEADRDVLRAEAEFALDRLPPGSYPVRATVMSGATVLGTATQAVK